MYNEINLLKTDINWINRPRYRWNLNKTEQMRIASVKVYIDNVHYSLVHDNDLVLIMLASNIIHVVLCRDDIF